MNIRAVSALRELRPQARWRSRWKIQQKSNRSAWLDIGFEHRDRVLEERGRGMACRRVVRVRSRLVPSRERSHAGPGEKLQQDAPEREGRRLPPSVVARTRGHPGFRPAAQSNTLRRTTFRLRAISTARTPAIADLRPSDRDTACISVLSRKGSAHSGQPSCVAQRTALRPSAGRTALGAAEKYRHDAGEALHSAGHH